MPGLIMLAIIVAIPMSFLLYFAWDRKQMDFVKENSEPYKMILELNSKYNFEVENLPRKCVCQHKTKYQFDRDKPYNALKRMLAEDIDRYRGISSKIEYDKMRYNEYLTMHNQICYEATSTGIDSKSSMSPSRFAKRQKILLEEARLKPNLNFKILSVIKYTSPQGQNKYEEHNEFNLSQINQMIWDIENEIEVKNTVQRQRQLERNKMNPRLRYDILKRDGFRCKACGASTQDGIQLHVDHIFPIAKGGLTVPENLQALCDCCNMGKGAQ